MQFSAGIIHIFLSASLAIPAIAIAQSPASNPHKEDTAMTRHAEGSFDVKTSPIPSDDATAGTSIGRFALDKQYHGDLEAIGKGEMLGAGNPASGTAGYVAIEQVTGSLGGHTGSFALQHTGAMDQGKFDLAVKVVPGSGTGELAGIAGTMTIVNAGGKHSYKFEYTLPAAK
jgi:hypothetical protein